MELTQAQALFTLRSVKGFLDEHAEALKSVLSTSTKLNLDSAIEVLSGHVIDQSSHTLEAQGQTVKHRTLREILMRDFMRPIARITKAELHNAPGIDPLHLDNTTMNNEQFVGKAEGMAVAARPYEATFVKAGMASDFIARMQDATKGLVDALLIRKKHLDKASTATGSVATKLVYARKIVGVLDALVKSVLHDDSTLLLNWKKARRFRLRNTASDTAATPAASDAAAPAISAPATPAPAA